MRGYLWLARTRSAPMLLTLVAASFLGLGILFGARVIAPPRDFDGNPLYRLRMTLIEIFSMGVLVSLVSAALLRNDRFLPARR